MTKLEIIITIIGVVGSLIDIGDVAIRLYKRYRKQPLAQFMNELANKNTPLKKQRQILWKIQKILMASGNVISNGYIMLSIQIGVVSSIFFEIFVHKTI